MPDDALAAFTNNGVCFASSEEIKTYYSQLKVEN
jgi:hypothetical protein